jgi:hypothetical protein
MVSISRTSLVESEVVKNDFYSALPLQRIAFLFSTNAETIDKVDV